MITYYIYQMTKHTNYRFEWWDWAKDEFNLNDYDLVYVGETDDHENDNDVLEKLFVKFNINHPEDFRGHSLSVSDVVKLIRGDKEVYYYCDAHDWVDVTDRCEGAL